ncbi:MAG: hypothetical protein M1309_00665 [Actinobacteria bacterium]|nr:hypothetical protein [Actinomycetota bacterium]
MALTAIVIILVVLPLLYLQLRLQARAIRHLSYLHRIGSVDDHSFLLWSTIIFFGGFIGAMYYLKQNGE